MGFFNTLINKVKKLSQKRLHIDTKNKTLQLLLHSNDETYFTLVFDEFSAKRTNDEALMQSYAIDAKNERLGTLYIETIRLKSLYDWYVDPKSAANLFIKSVFGNQTVVTNTQKSDYFSLTKYADANGYEFILLHFSLITHDIFIIDQKGKLYQDMLEIFNINDQLLLQNPNPTPQKVKPSIVSLNLTQQFFHKKSH